MEAIGHVRHQHQQHRQEHHEAEPPQLMVVVSMHWGPNYRWRPSTTFRRFARALVDRAGVDLIHGHSSHHPQAIEIYRGRPIFYG